MGKLILNKTVFKHNKNLILHIMQYGCQLSSSLLVLLTNMHINKHLQKYIYSELTFEMVILYLCHAK